MSEEWGPWINHDGSGCPVPVGTYIHAIEINCNHKTDEKEGWLSPKGYMSKCWVMKDPYGPMTQILRYRIRKPKGLTILQRIASQPQDERIEA